MTGPDPGGPDGLDLELDTCTCGRLNLEHSYRELLDCLARDLARLAAARHLASRRN